MFEFFALAIAIVALIVARKTFEQVSMLRARLDAMEAVALQARPVPPLTPFQELEQTLAAPPPGMAAEQPPFLAETEPTPPLREAEPTAPVFPVSRPLSRSAASTECEFRRQKFNNAVREFRSGGRCG